MATTKLVSSQKAVDQLKPEGSASSKWSIKLVLDALLPVYLIVSSLESLNHIKLVLFNCIRTFGRLFSYEGKEELFYIRAIKWKLVLRDQLYCSKLILADSRYIQQVMLFVVSSHKFNHVPLSRRFNGWVTLQLLYLAFEFERN